MRAPVLCELSEVPTVVFPEEDDVVFVDPFVGPLAAPVSFAAPLTLDEFPVVVPAEAPLDVPPVEVVAVWLPCVVVVVLDVCVVVEFPLG